MKNALALIPLALTLACGGAATDAKKTDATKKEGGKVEAKKEEPKKEEAAAGPLDLGKVGLKMDAPAGSTVSDGIGGGVMVTGPGLVVSVDVASDSRPKTGEDAQKEADMYSPQDAKIEKIADGWILTFVNEGGAGKNYWVNARREIGGKAYWCETTSSSPEQQTNAVNACKSLKQ